MIRRHIWHKVTTRDPKHCIVTCACGLYCGTGRGVTDIFGKPIKRWDKDTAGIRAAKPDIYKRVEEIISPALAKYS